MAMRLIDRRMLAIGLLSLLTGCASLPTNGPTAHAIVRQSKTPEGVVKFRIVDLGLNAVDAMNSADRAGAEDQPTLATLAVESRNDLIGPGDVLKITIYEIGVTLFGGTPSIGGAGAGGFDPSARAEPLADVVVDDKGEISLPYIGTIKAAGLTAEQVEKRIVNAMAGKSQDPRAHVVVAQSVTNVVFVSGAVGKPGRVPLTLGREHLLDAIAVAGGSLATADDTVVRLSRGGKVVEQRLGTIRSSSPDDVALNPGDRIELIKGPKTYTVFGAVARIQQVPFETSKVSLAEALARAGGPSDAQADASAIFLFRYRINRESGNEEPVIYRLNLLKPDSYFLAQRFAMQDKDVIYIANAATNQPSKLVSIINQLFTPFILARSILP